jgi:hypothetical protein
VEWISPYSTELSTQANTFIVDNEQGLQGDHCSMISYKINHFDENDSILHFQMITQIILKFNISPPYYPEKLSSIQEINTDQFSIDYYHPFNH